MLPLSRARRLAHRQPRRVASFVPAPSGRGLSLVLLAALLIGAGCSSPESSRQQRSRAETGAPPPGAAQGTGAPGGSDSSSAWADVAPAEPAANLILITLDTTRRDRLSCYGFAKPTTPHLDRLAEEGILFEQACTPVPITLPAHATMLTGLYPFQHGVRHNGSYVLSGSVRTLAEMLKERGYETSAILAAFTVERRFGLAQGFDHYDDRFSAAFAPGSIEAQRVGAEVTRLALEWIAHRSGKPFFLWVHYFDPHAPYHPPEPYKSRFPGDAYSGEVAYMDAAVGDLIAGLEAQELLEKSVLMVAGDHGEGLGEHHEATHSTFIYQTTQRVPLILRFPRSAPWQERQWREHRIEDQVSLADLLPTAWNALGFARDDLPPVAGQSLLPVIAGTAAGHAWLYHESLVPDLDYGMSELRGLQIDPWKYIRAPQPELYNLAEDPGELRNLAGSERERVATMEARLAAILQAEGQAAAPLVMDEESREKLRSLGYLGGSASPAAARRADPKEQTGVGRATAWAQTLAERNRFTDAIAVLDSLLRVQPRTRLALRLRAQYLAALERGEEAVSAFETALADCQGCPDEFRLLQEQTGALLIAGRIDDALRRARFLLEARPEEQGSHLLLGDILERRGNLDEARAAYLREAELYAYDPLPLIRLGKLEMAQNRGREAEQALRQALAVNSLNPDALVLLSEVLAKSGRAQEAEGLVDQALAANPHHAAANYRKAWILRQSGRKTAAVECYREALRGQPANGTFLYELGSLYAELGRNREAVDSYRAAVQTGSAPAGAYANLGTLAGQAGRFQEAIQMWQEALKHQPSEQEAAIIRANIRKAEELSRGGAGKGQ